jgi:predicted transcriptional regulator
VVRDNILAALSGGRLMTRSQIGNVLGIGRGGVYLQLRELIKEGLVIRHGLSDYYRLNDASPHNQHVARYYSDVP